MPQHVYVTLEVEGDKVVKVQEETGLDVYKRQGLYYGVPLILIPHQFEQLLNARQVTARNAGLLIDDQVKGQPVTPAQLRQALQEVLANRAYAEGARQIQQLLRDTGGFRQAADAIQATV